MNTKGVLLINLGTPEKCDFKSVFSYLRQFLNDPRVIDLPFLIRWPLVNLLILPFRFRKSTHAYQQIWTTEGSPLLTNSRALIQALSTVLPHHYRPVLAMRYGEPSIQKALSKLQDCEEIIVIPLFPQYASATNGSALATVLQTLATQWNIPNLRVIKDFYRNPHFIDAYAKVIEQNIRGKKTDLLLFSYHGLPKRHLQKSACQETCDPHAACLNLTKNHLYCYRAHCYRTSQLLAERLNLSKTDYQVSFQSRLGKTPWITPYTDVILTELIQNGILNLAIVCPSFVSDCLETLEEVNIRARAQWQSLGGHEFTFIPCLNAHPHWVEGLANIIMT